jgi:uncharacterized protein
MINNEIRNRAHVVPFFVFLGIMVLIQFAEPFIGMDNKAQPWWRRRPEYLGMLLQIIVCLPMFIYWRKAYEWNFNKGWSAACLGSVAGVVGIAIWILPTQLYTTLDLGSDSTRDPRWYKYLGLAERKEGFDARIFEDSPFWYWTTILLRFVRAVIVVALVEEIFWRGFFTRFVMNPDGNYWKRPFGEFHWRSYCIVTPAFMAIHAPVDWLGAFFFGSMMYWLAVKSKSLFACIVMHAVANLLLGIYALAFEKYGLW